MPENISRKKTNDNNSGDAGCVKPQSTCPLNFSSYCSKCSHFTFFITNCSKFQVLCGL